MKHILSSIALSVLCLTASTLAQNQDSEGTSVRIACDPKSENRCPAACRKASRIPFDRTDPEFRANCRNTRRCQAGEITGQLTSCLTGEPIADVRILARSNRSSKAARTNTQGIFRITRLSRDSYTVAAGAPFQSKLGSCIVVAPLAVSNMGSVCVCPGGTAQCGDSCCNLQSDEDNCGTLGVLCSQTAACLAGSCVEGAPQLNFTVSTNGQDADIIPGPTIVTGSPVQWTYVVQNPTASVISAIQVTDDSGVAVSCPATVLGPSETITCTAAGTALAGQFTNTATVSGILPDGTMVIETDSSHYFACESCVTPTPPPTPAQDVGILEEPDATTGTVPTAAPTAQVTGSVTPIATGSPSVSPSPISTITASATASPTATAVPTQTRTVTPTATIFLNPPFAPGAPFGAPFSPASPFFLTPAPGAPGLPTSTTVTTGIAGIGGVTSVTGGTTVIGGTTITGGTTGTSGDPLGGRVF